jgi:hypothetical protein
VERVMIEHSVSDQLEHTGAGGLADSVLAVQARLRVALDGAGVQGIQAGALRRVQQELQVLEDQARVQDLALRRLRDQSASGLGVRALRALETLVRLSIIGGDLRQALHGVAMLSAEVHQQSGDHAWATVIVGHPRAPELLTCNTQHAQHLEGLQLAAGQGPSFEAINRAQVVTSPDLCKDQRWPRLRAAVDLDPTSCLAVPLLIEDRPAGVLCVYGDPGVVGADGETNDLIRAFAAGAQTLLLEARTIEEITRARDQFEEALTSRAIIDQAKGMIMMARRCSPEEAFQYLVGLSNNWNRKLRDLAASLVTGDTRTLEAILRQEVETSPQPTATDHTCQMGGPAGSACSAPAEMKLTDSWGDTAWSCLNHADEALLSARGVFLATEDRDGLAAYRTRKWRTGHQQFWNRLGSTG